MKNKYGHMVHAECGARVLVRINEKETLSAQCDTCDSTDYAQKGTGKHARWMERIERVDTAPAPKPADDKKPAGKKAAGIW